MFNSLSLLFKNQQIKKYQTIAHLLQHYLTLYPPSRTKNKSQKNIVLESGNYFESYEAFYDLFELSFKTHFFKSETIHKNKENIPKPIINLSFIKAYKIDQASFDNIYFLASCPFLFRTLFVEVIIVQLAKEKIRMNAQFYAIIQEQLKSMSTHFITTEQTKAVSICKKKNYQGLQEDSRKKSKKKHWKPQQNKRYVEFLRNNMEIFEKNREYKRLMKINILMSEHVKSKNSTQCRSHHQKMLAHYKSIENIIQCLCSEESEDQKKVEMKIQEHTVVPVQLEQEVQEIEEIEESPKVSEQKDIFDVLSLGYNEEAFFF